MVLWDFCTFLRGLEAFGLLPHNITEVSRTAAELLTFSLVTIFLRDSTNSVSTWSVISDIFESISHYWDVCGSRLRQKQHVWLYIGQRGWRGTEVMHLIYQILLKWWPGGRRWLPYHHTAFSFPACTSNTAQRLLLDPCCVSVAALEASPVSHWEEVLIQHGRGLRVWWIRHNITSVLIPWSSLLCLCGQHKA